MQLREWGTDRVYPLPSPSAGEQQIGASARSWLQLQDRDGYVSRKHAHLRYEANVGWLIRDAGSRNGLWIDGERVSESSLSSGTEIGVGRLRLVVETPRLVRIRELLCRWIGWNSSQRSIVDRGIRAVRWFLAGRAPLCVVADGDVVALAHHLHRETLGEERPFLLSDPRRRRAEPSPRTFENFASSASGLRAAAGGSLCVWAERLPPDFTIAREAYEAPENRARLIICAHTVEQLRLLAGGVIQIPTLSTRADELPRIIGDYAHDAIRKLGARPASFTQRDQAWIVERDVDSLAEIERSTIRRVALNEYGGITAAAEHLGLTHGAFSRWLARRARNPRRRS